MKKHALKQVMGGLTMLGMVATAVDAQTVSILPSNSTPLLGDSVLLSMVGTGFTDNADGGDFTVSWDPSVLSYTGITIANPPWDTQFLDETSVASGKLDSVFLGTSTFGGAGPDFDIAELSFTYNGGVTAVTAMDDLVGWAAPGAVPIPVTYESATVGTPVPAAVWLFGSGMLGLIGVARRRQAA